MLGDETHTCSRTKVMTVRREGLMVTRYRQCLECGERVVTWERRREEWLALSERLRILEEWAKARP